MDICSLQVLIHFLCQIRPNLFSPSYSQAPLAPASVLVHAFLLPPPVPRIKFPCHSPPGPALPQVFFPPALYNINTLLSLPHTHIIHCKQLLVPVSLYAFLAQSHCPCYSFVQQSYLPWLYVKFVFSSSPPLFIWSQWLPVIVSLPCQPSNYFCPKLLSLQTWYFPPLYWTWAASLSKFHMSLKLQLWGKSCLGMHRIFRVLAM